MKKLLIIPILLLAIVSARADDYKSMVFETSPGGTTAVDVSSLVMTVSVGKLVVTNTAGTQQFTLTELSKMYFSTSEATGIKGVAADNSTSPVVAFDISGRKVGSYDSLDVAKASLKQGVYVIKQNGKTFKIAVK